ncbi:MAG: secondary thiamine-phosphate synthase enzyme YjbQ [Candidatus Binatia bacterium]|nr:secondary thiamine-phosphate synthase enzyme YjbQ [Candidatus Binatia bacterium]
MVIKAKTLRVDTARRVQLLDLTDEVTRFLHESGVWRGLGVVSTLHTTTAVFFTETQDALWDDVEAFLYRLVAERIGYKHNDPRFSTCERNNAAAHLRAIVLGGAVTLQVEEGALVLGQFQRIVFAELDGPRPRSLRMQFMGEGIPPQRGSQLGDWQRAMGGTAWHGSAG